MQNILNVPDSNTSAVTDENSSWKEETLAAWIEFLRTVHNNGISEAKSPMLSLDETWVN
jgi:hypothetical protein